MDSGKARNITFACLILLNAVLFACNMLFTDINRYRMTTDTLKDITEVLLNNNIYLNTSVGRDYSPLARLEMTDAEYNDDKLKSIFMQNAADSELIAESGRRVYRNESQSLSINDANGSVVYRNRDILPGIPDMEYAAALSKRIKDEITKDYPGLVSDMPQNIPYETDEGLIFEYRQIYKGNIINSNSLTITVGEDGVSRAEFMYSPIIDRQNMTKEICSPNEALLTCMYEIENMYGSANVSIVRMDLVYDKLESAEGPQIAEPFYRIYLLDSIVPILVNAYTNMA